MRAWLAGMLFSVVCPSVALAGARPIEAPPAPLPGVVVSGVAEVSDLEVTVRCGALDLLSATQCQVHARFYLQPGSDATASVALSPGSPAELLVDDAPPEPMVGGPRRRIDLRFERHLAISADQNEDVFVMVPVRARHMVLGESTATRASGDGAYGTLIEGAILRGVIRAHVDAPHELVVNIAGQTLEGDTIESGVELPAETTHLALVLEAPAHQDQPIQDGGPLLLLGARFNLFGEDGGNFLLGGGYEVGIADYVLASLAFETNFESIMESLVVEIATPELLVIFPSLAAGVGVVARQLGNRDADAALRLRIAFNVMAIGFVGDFDYWPAIGDWTATMACRLSI